MDLINASRALAALAQESRLAAFRLLVQAGPDGMAAGDIARRLAIPPSTLSTHLSLLVQAGLVTARRASRSIRYAVDFEGMRALLMFLMEDCCRGNPKICTPLLDQVLGDCCRDAGRCADESTAIKESIPS